MKDKDYTYSTGDKMPRSPDAPFHETKSGFTFAPEGLSNNITGTPPSPGMRGNTHSVGSEPLGRGRYKNKLRRKEKEVQKTKAIH